MTTTAKGRRRYQALFDFLDRYPAATTDQLAKLIWSGNDRLARGHLLRLTQAGLLRRLPHPLFRNGAYVYTSRSQRSSTHSQKVLHHLSLVDFHIAVTRQLGKYGARVIPEMQWGPGLIPDQTVIWRDSVWAVEHHLSGQFSHTPDYHRFMEEETYELCHWWRAEMAVGLVVVTTSALLDQVVAQLRRREMPGLTWQVATREGILRELGSFLRPKTSKRGAGKASLLG